MSHGGVLDVVTTNPDIPTSFITDSGSAIPIANTLEILGTNGVTTTGSGSTVSVTGLNATAGINAAGATVGVASFDSADFTVTTGFVSLLQDPGILTINTISANGARNFTIAAGPGITITPDINTITINSTGAAGYTDVGISSLLVLNNGYFVTAASTQTLPASPLQGSSIEIVCDTVDTVVVLANAGQTIRIGTTVTATAGTATSTVRGNALTLVYRAATASWIQNSAPQGIWDLI